MLILSVILLGSLSDGRPLNIPYDGHSPAITNRPPRSVDRLGQADPVNIRNEPAISTVILTDNEVAATLPTNSLSLVMNKEAVKDDSLIVNIDHIFDYMEVSKPKSHDRTASDPRKQFKPDRFARQGNHGDYDVGYVSTAEQSVYLEDPVHMESVTAFACAMRRQLQIYTEVLAGRKVSVLIVRALANYQCHSNWMSSQMKTLTLMESVLAHLGFKWAVIQQKRINSRVLLAKQMIRVGHLEEAVALLKDVVHAQELSLAEDHPSRLMSQHELARAYRATGQVKKAVALLDEVVKIEEHSLPEDHPSRLSSLHNLAIYHWECGSYVTALSIMARVVVIRKAVLDEDQPDLRNSENWLKQFEEEMIDEFRYSRVKANN